MESSIRPINYKLEKIETNQFAIIEGVYTEGSDYNFTTELSFKFSVEQRIIVPVVKFIFDHDQKPFLIIQGSCIFSIAEDSWDLFLIKDKIVIPRMFAGHLVSITVGTVRGILHAKTEDTVFSQFIIPSINVEELVYEDIPMDNL